MGWIYVKVIPWTLICEKYDNIIIGHPFKMLNNFTRNPLLNIPTLMNITVAKFIHQNLGKRENKYLEVELFRETFSNSKEPHNRKGKRVRL